MPHIAEFVFCVALCALPTAFCVLIWRKSPLVNSFGRMLATMGCISLVGWALVTMAKRFFGWLPEGGLAYACAVAWPIAFGWAYVWVVGIPILLFSWLLRCCFDVGWWIRRKLARREFERGKPIWGVALLLVVALIAYPYARTARPEERWRDWGDRQYRLRRVDNLVHVEIREGETVADVNTRASTFSRYELKKASGDELLLKSWDIGNWLIGKRGGHWRVYVRENGGIRFVDNESLPDETADKVKGGEVRIPQSEGLCEQLFYTATWRIQNWK